MAADRDEADARAEMAADWGRWSLTVQSRVPPAWRRALRVDPMLRDARVAVDVVLSRTRRIMAATEEITCENREGESFTYRPLLLSEPDLEDAVGVGVADPEARAVRFSLPGFECRIDEILASAWPMSGQAEVSLIVPGMTWDERLVHVRGPLDGPIRFSAREEWVDIGCVDPQIASRELPRWTLDETRWPKLADVDEDEESGTFGQLILGSSVGVRCPLVVTESYARPCPRVDYSNTSVLLFDTFLVGQGHLTVGDIWVEGNPLIDTQTPEILHTLDGRGLPVTLIQFDGNDGVSDLSVNVHASALREPMALIPAIRILLRDFAGLGSERLSQRLLSEAEAKAGDGGGGDGTGRSSPLVYLNEPARAIDYLAGELLREYPFVSLGWDGSALGPVVIDHRADPIFDLEAGIYPCLGIVDAGRYEASPASAIRTSFTVRYNYDPIADVYRGIVTRNPDNSTICQMGQGIVDGDQPMEPIDAQSVGDKPTAEYTADWLVEHFGRPYLAVTLECFPVAWLIFRPGDTVRWTDRAQGLVEQRAIVVRRAWSAGAVEITLRIYPALWTAIGGGSQAFPSNV